MDKQKNRILSFDIIRIAAIAMVVMIHSSFTYVSECMPRSEGFMWGNIFDSLCRPGAPLFVMLSGALMLNEHKQFDRSYAVKHVIGVIIPLAIWSLLYAVGFEVLLPIVKHESLSLRSFVKSLVMGHYHLWFLYMIIGLYLVTPILRLFVKEENKKYILYFLILSLLFRFTVPILNLISNQAIGSGDYFKEWMSKFKLDFVGPYLAYYLFGWYISTNRITKKSRAAIYVLGIIGFVVTMTGTYIFTSEECKAYESTYSDGSINVFFYSAAVYVFLHYYFQERTIHSVKLNAFITELSKMSFGVYALHVAVISVAGKLFFAEKVGYNIPLMWVFALVVSYIVTFAASKIPFIRKIFKF